MAKDLITVDEVNGRKRYRLRKVLPDGRRIQKTIGWADEMSRQNANDIAYGLISQYIQEDITGRAQKTKPVMLFNDACDLYIQTLQTNIYQVYKRRTTSKPSTDYIRNKIVYLKYPIVYFGKQFVHNISIDRINQYIEKRRKELQPSSLNKEIITMRQVFNLLVEKEILETNVFNRVKSILVDNEITEFFTKEEFDLMIEHSNGHLRDFIYLAFYTGLRKSELLNLKFSDINFTTRKILLKETKQGKAQYRRLNDKAIEYLLKLKEQNRSGYVIEYKDSHIADIKTAFNKLMKKLQINKSIHCLRHSFGTYLAAKGVPLHNLRELMGHKDVKTTMRYAHVLEDQLLDDVNKI